MPETKVKKPGSRKEDQKARLAILEVKSEWSCGCASGDCGCGCGCC